jgi:hypothetical protein
MQNETTPTKWPRLTKLSHTLLGNLSQITSTEAISYTTKIPHYAVFCLTFSKNIDIVTKKDKS